MPTWKEVGVNAVADNWRALVGPQGISATQIAYWDQTLAAMVKSPEWQQALRANQWEDQYQNSTGAMKFMEREYKELAALLTELGEVKGR